MSADQFRRTKLSFLVRCLVLLVIFLLPSGGKSQTTSDPPQAAAEDLLAEGLRLRRAGTKESLESSISKFGEALKIVRSMGDHPLKASILFVLGSMCVQLGKGQEALDYYSDSVPIFHATNNPKNEAITLNNIGDISAALDDQNTAIGYYTKALVIRQSLGDHQRIRPLTRPHRGL